MNQWLSPPKMLSLASGEVHIWVAELERWLPMADEWSEILSSAEMTRAQRFVTTALTNSFVVAHAIKRMILARYLQTSPANLEFMLGAQGKPYLLPAPGAPTIEFNLSHTRGIALYAVALDTPVGIDVELLGRDVQVEEIAARFFTQAEHKKIMALPETERQQAFYHCWTRKEAFIKAEGKGLSYSLDKFEVDFSSPVSQVSSVNEQTNEVMDWTVLELDYSPFHAAAVAVQSVEVPRLSLWRFELP